MAAFERPSLVRDAAWPAHLIVTKFVMFVASASVGFSGAAGSA